MSPIWDDLRFGVRLLWRHPGFSILAVLTLALGIGANTAVFSIVRGVLLKPLPYRDPEQLLWFGGREARFGAEREGVSIPDLLDVRLQGRSVKQVAAYSIFTSKLAVTGAGEPEQVDGITVTANFFDVLGVPPALGRGFQEGEDKRGGPRVAVVSYDLWMRNYAGQADVVGKTIVLNTISHQIIGVMPEGFAYPSRLAVWIPISIGSQASKLREYRSYFCLARMAPGLAPAVGIGELDSIAGELARTYPASSSGYRFEVLPLAEQVAGPVKDTLYLLWGISALLLLIGAANVANLLLARATTRQREVAIRHALGAPRAVIIRQLFSESMVLAFAGGTAGSLVAWWTIRAIRTWNPPSLPRAAELAVDPASLLFALFVSIATALLFGLAPAMQAARSEQFAALRDSGARGGGEGAGRARLRNFLVVGEVALALVMLAGAGLLLESLRQLLAVDPGFRLNDVLTTEITLPMPKFRTPDGAAAFVEQYLERLRGMPGVQMAGSAIALPMGSLNAFYEFRIQGDPPAPIPPIAGFTSVTPGYLEAMGIGLRQGRFFTNNDGRDGPKVIVISEPMARQYFAGRNPIGQRLQIVTGANVSFDGEVIGVAAGTRHENLTQAPRVELYVPLAQSPFPFANIVIRSTMPREPLAAAMKQALRELDRDLPLYRVRTMEEVVLESAVAPRARGYLTSLFAIAALLLASIGIYGVMSYSVGRRTQEIGIRMAMGATPGEILRLVLSQSGRLVLLGAGTGLLLTVVLGRVLSSMLFGVSTFDPMVLGLVSVLLLFVATIATLIPAWRAARIDPLVALRRE